MAAGPEGGILYQGAGGPGFATGVAANGFGRDTGGNGAGIAGAPGAEGGGAGLLSNGAANRSGNITGGENYANGLRGGTTTNLNGASGGSGGGGGGSLFDSGFGTQNLVANVSGANTGNGLVVNSAATSTPVPKLNALAIVGMGFAALGSLRWRRRATAA